ncbi:MAG: hypothetical protein ACXAD7_28305, partial [Candidatus Kariarchaeaceae archaeon]
MNKHDILIHNAKIWTPEKIYTWMTIKDDCINQLGVETPDLGIAERIFDLDKRVLLPGLHDAH